MLDAQAGIFFGQLVQRGREFLFLALVRGFHRQPEHRLREIQRLQMDLVLVVRIVQHGVEMDFLDLGHAGDVAGHGVVDLHVVLALQFETDARP